MLTAVRTPVQIAVCQMFGASTRVLPYIMFSDGTEMSNGTSKFHPVYLWVASYPLEIMRQSSSYRLVALIPVLDAASLGMDPE